MKGLRIRQWMIIGLMMFMTLPWLSYMVIHVLNQNVLHPEMRQQSAQQTQAITSSLRAISADAVRWHSSEWQSSLREHMNHLHIGVTITDSSGTVVFRSGNIGYWSQPNEQAIVIEGGRPVGTVRLFAASHWDGFAAICALLGLVAVVLFVGWQMKRSVVRPLEAMSRAARRIAVGDLDFKLPMSRVIEIADVQDAFHAMGSGLRESINRQAQLEEERRFFIGAVAHDLRTPLFVLRGYLEGLERGMATSPEKTAKYLGICRKKSDQLDRLVSDLFAYAKSEFLEQSLHRGRFEFGTLVARMIESVQSRASAKAVSVSLDSTDHHCVVEGDEHLIERVLENLLDNAIRHTPPEGAIVVRWREEPKQIVFSVTDTGPGIPPHDQPHVFEPLYRGETSRNRETGGTGLGLTIARRIMRAHGGDIVAANGPSGGAEFTGWIPRVSQTMPSDTHD